MLSRSLRRFFSADLGQLSSKARSLIEQDKKYGCNNFSTYPIVLSRGKGAEVWDVDGKRYIDCVMGISAVNQGHGHPKIRAAMLEQFDRVALVSRTVHNDRLPEWQEYITKLLGYDRVCFMNTGVEGTETCVKFARRWGYDGKGIPDGQATIVFAKGNFWGRSIAACGSSDDPKRFARFGPFNGLNFELVEYGNAQEVEALFKSNPHIAGIVLEPIQGEGGIIIPPPGYFKRIRELCNQYNVLLIADEIQTGLGRTGKLMGMDWFDGVRPDMIAIGKSLSGGVYPISACLADEKIMKNIQPGDHGSTYAGNPLSAAIGLAAVKVIVEEKLPENAMEQGTFISKYMNELRKQYPFLIDFRGPGLMMALEFDKNYKKQAIDFHQRMVEEGILSIASKGPKIRLFPPLTIQRNIAEEIVGKLEKILKTF